nr:MAG TPA: hypothetical protein [Caudoviricetes sp.]
MVYVKATIPHHKFVKWLKINVKDILRTHQCNKKYYFIN